MTLFAAGLRRLKFAAAAFRFKLGSFGGRRRYEIAGGYRHRETTGFDDAAGKTDQWQREVYEAARTIMREERLRTVVDVGCGSGYKLVNILGEFETIGIDLPGNIEWVRQAYPDRKWIAASFDEVDLPSADLVICADVIEHVADPEALLRSLVGMAEKWVVLSTPDRDLAYGPFSTFRFGPPENLTHLREWDMEEFRRFVSPYLDVERHEITNREQATQMIVGRVRNRV